jgi:hypothetical protein
MKRLPVFLISLAVFGILVALVVTFMINGSVQQIIDKTSGVNTTVKDQVMSIALNDPAVKRGINESSGAASIEYIKPGDAGTFVKDRERYAGVSVSANEGGEPVNFKVIVDVTTMREMGVQYGGVPPITSSWVTIPPGSGVYELLVSMTELSSGMKFAQAEISSGAVVMELTPSDASLYPMILDEDNFTRFMNGSAYDVADIIDPQTQDSIKVDGSRPVSSGWKALYYLPQHMQADGTYGADKKWYYLIVMNKGESEVTITYKNPSMPTFQG